MTASEAREKLEAWVVLLKAKLKHIDDGPWIAEDNGQVGGVFAANGYEICGGHPHEGWMDPEGAESQFIAFSGSAVPAMLAGIEAALNQHMEPVPGDVDDSGPQDMTLQHDGLRSRCDSWTDSEDEMIIAIAEAYEPYFQEVQS